MGSAGVGFIKTEAIAEYLEKTPKDIRDMVGKIRILARGPLGLKENDEIIEGRPYDGYRIHPKFQIVEE